MELFHLKSGSFKLERLPKTLKGGLRAWNAADDLLLQHVFEHYSSLLKNNVPALVVNDSFGALAVGLHEAKTHSWSDSSITHLATQENFKLNKLEADQCALLPSTQALKEQYDLVLIKIPKTLALLEDQLCKLKSHIHAETVIVASAMTKHIHTSTLKLFEKIIGSTTTSRATKKARLIFAKNDADKNHNSPYPKILKEPLFDLTLSNHANVFSKDQLDIGTRFMLQYLDKCPNADHILDLGCGNGALGVYISRLQAQTKISFVDESYMAIASAQESFTLNNDDIDTEARYIVSDCLNQVSFDDDSKPDLILCNPPFHQEHSIGDHIAWQMFKQSREVLKSNGELWVIGNRHLAYHVKLKKLFGNCRTVATNKKFVLLAVLKKDR